MTATHREIRSSALALTPLSRARLRRPRIVPSRRRGGVAADPDRDTGEHDGHESRRLPLRRLLEAGPPGDGVVAPGLARGHPADLVLLRSPMNKAMLNSLTEAERLLVDETTPDALARLDEDALLELHQRIRRARTKYVKLYRRGASAEVRKRGGRGISYPANQRARDKAEIFESALARGSRQGGPAPRA